MPATPRWLTEEELAVDPVDAARMRWYRYVVNWSSQDQRVMVSTMQRQAHDFRLAFAWPRDWRGKATKTLRQSYPHAAAHPLVEDLIARLRAGSFASAQGILRVSSRGGSLEGARPAAS